MKSCEPENSQSRARRRWVRPFYTKSTYRTMGKANDDFAIRFSRVPVSPSLQDIYVHLCKSLLVRSICILIFVPYLKFTLQLGSAGNEVKKPPPRVVIALVEYHPLRNPLVKSNSLEQRMKICRRGISLPRDEMKH